MSYDNENNETDNYYYDSEAADLAVYFIENYIYHVKGKFAGKKFKLQDWQKEQIIKPIFGWKNKDGTRKYRTVYIFLPRKNGKSTIVAAIALLILLTDKEFGAEIYSAAGDAKQAGIIFNTAKEMLNNNLTLKKKTEIYKNSIVYPKYASTYQTISSTASTKHGFDSHAILFDELHTQKSRELWDVLTTSVAARKQPLVIAITTAGSDRNTICWEVHEYALKVHNKEIIDESFLSILYMADEDDDWTDEKVWIKANPGIGHSIYLSYLREQCEKAKKSPALENTFRRLHLNQWTQQEQRWLPMIYWRQTNYIQPDCTGNCWAGLDLSRSTDLGCVSYVFPKLLKGKDSNNKDSWTYHVKCRYFLPRENVEELSKRDRVDYLKWNKQGLITLSEGPVISHDEILDTIKTDSKLFDIKKIAFDRYNSSDIISKLIKLKFTLVEHGQGFLSMNTPTNELLNLVLLNKLIHGGNPILEWNAECISVKTDTAGNIKPDREKSRGKIDGIVATIMGLGLAIKYKSDITAYKDRGLRTLSR